MSVAHGIDIRLTGVAAAAEDEHDQVALRIVDMGAVLARPALRLDSGHLRTGLFVFAGIVRHGLRAASSGY